LTHRDHASTTDRRAFLQASLGAMLAGSTLAGSTLAGSMLALPGVAAAQSAQGSFEQWRDAFRPRALARGVSEATYARVMSLKPDTSVYAQIRSQPEFNEALWQYLNRRVSDWRIITGKARAKEHAALLARIENEYGVDRYLMLSLWGVESSFGEVIDNPKYMRPVIPALAALAWGEPRRRTYWERAPAAAFAATRNGATSA